MTAVLTGVPLSAAPGPATVDRNEGTRIAREELSKPVYGDAEPTLVERIYTWVTEWFERLGQQVEQAIPGGWWVLGPLLVLLFVLLALLIGYARPARQAQRRGDVFDTGTPLTAADHRAAADRHAAAGEYAAAIRERLRAITRDLEERAILTPRPGRTATELAAEASTTLPAQRDALHRAAALFNDIVYGERPATADDDRLLRQLEEQLRETRPAGNGGRTG